MELVSSSEFWTIVAIVVSALGVQRAVRADARREQHNLRTEMGKRFEEAEKRGEAREKRLAEQISGVKQELGHRIDRMEDRMNENHREVSVGLAETNATVSALSAKLDERSSPRRLEGGGLASATGSVASGVSVREPSASYSGHEPKGEGEPEVPEDDQHDIEHGRPDQD